MRGIGKAAGSSALLLAMLSGTSAAWAQGGTSSASPQVTAPAVAPAAAPGVAAPSAPPQTAPAVSTYRAEATEAALPAPVASALRAARLPVTAMGIYVQEVGANRPVLSVNADKSMSPASVMKLVTTYSALELLGPAFTWKTGIYETGTRNGDVLQGDLVLKGSGDPKLTQEDLGSALRAVRARGIREIAGNIVLDHSVFEATNYDAARFDGDPMRAYNAGPDGLLVNFKAFALTFAPDEASGTVNVTAEPRPAGLPIRAAVTLVKGPCTDLRGPALKTRIDATGITVAGPYALNCGVRSLWLHPYELTAAQYDGAVLRQLWSDAGGTLTGDVRDGPLPATARLLYEIESESLAETIRDINKFSNNVMARELYLDIGHELLRLPANPDRSYRAIRNWLLEKKIGGEELVMENGSGLSRIERIAPQTLGRMLVAAFRSPVMPEFISSMPLVAYDGTMQRRLRSKDIAGQAHIKTGTLNDVRSIAGYVLAASGKRYAVVCLVNSPYAGGAQALQDALLQWVYAEN
ncbi:MAG TPA: D-alanyl-D-alanine carboxypeptidase/D-alanyl-D-alanine-endopeptidase [Burkholderiales bacterium]|jgi:D-alanyl-D-alanine carboxypeptidase/D-alanyl-D-alanine-endopeptidase (penicillin-binding protein 4)